jgi:hypothetical protein
MMDDDFHRSDIQPFSIDVAPQILSDLKQRLKNTRWTSQIDGTEWDAGTDVNYLRDLVRYWDESFDRREQERLLNQFEHFKTALDGIGIHFIHARGKGPAPSPLILTHGYPAGGRLSARGFGSFAGIRSHRTNRLRQVA